MQHLQLTPPRRSRSASTAATAATAAAAARSSSLTPARGGRSTAALTSSTATANFRRDEDSVSSFEELSAGMGGNECPICLEHPIPDDVASINGCEHKFCTVCINGWAYTYTHNDCPLCRALFTSIVSADGAIQQVSGRRSAAADLEAILARLFRLSREDVESLSELSLAHGAYWSVIAAAINNTLNELDERTNQLERRFREHCDRFREFEERMDQLEQMFYEHLERWDDLTHLTYLNHLRLNEVHFDGTWMLEEGQEIYNQLQQHQILSVSQTNENYQLKEEIDQINYETVQLNEEKDQIRDETNQILRDAFDQFGSASPLPTLANLPTLRRAVQIVIDSENTSELTTEMLANLQA